MKKLYIVVVIAVLLAGVGTAFLLRNKPAKTSPATTGPTYLALGDSVAAGYGLETASDSSACDRTQEAYPNLVASSLKLSLQSFACSGATIASGITGSQTVNQLALTPQLDAALKTSSPKLITITIGANDIGWTDILGTCISTDCGSPAQTSTIDTKLSTLKTNIATILTRIKDTYRATPPKVIVTGYYDVFPLTTSGCVVIPGISAAEQTWWNGEADKLNQALISTVASYSFASYVPINFSGHDLCSATPWVQGIQNRGPFHPTDEGQAAIAQAISAVYPEMK